MDISYLASHNLAGFSMNTHRYPEPLKTVVDYNTFLSQGGESFLWITAGSIIHRYWNEGIRQLLHDDTPCQAENDLTAQTAGNNKEVLCNADPLIL
jgi:hypothetical protein